MFYLFHASPVACEMLCRSRAQLVGTPLARHAPLLQVRMEALFHPLVQLQIVRIGKRVAPFRPVLPGRRKPAGARIAHHRGVAPHRKHCGEKAGRERPLLGQSAKHAARTYGNGPRQAASSCMRTHPTNAKPSSRRCFASSMFGTKPASAETLREIGSPTDCRLPCASGRYLSAVLHMLRHVDTCHMREPDRRSL